MYFDSFKVIVFYYNCDYYSVSEMPTTMSDIS